MRHKIAMLLHRLANRVEPLEPVGQVEIVLAPRAFVIDADGLRQRLNGRF